MLKKDEKYEIIQLKTCQRRISRVEALTLHRGNIKQI